MTRKSPVLSVDDVKKVIGRHRQERVKHGLSEAAARYRSRKQWELELKHKLENAIPVGRKYRVLRKLAHLFDEEKIVKNYRLVQCFVKPVIGKGGRLRKLSEKDYESRKSTGKDDVRLRNHIKVINIFWKNIGYAVRFSKHSSKVVLIKLVGGK